MKQKMAKKGMRDFFSGVVQSINTKEKVKQKFSYGLGINYNWFKPFVDKIRDVEKKHLKEYYDEQENLFRKFADKDKAGNPIKAIEGYQIPKENGYALEEAARELNEKYQKELDENEAFLSEVEEVEVYMIDNNDFPEWPSNLAFLLLPMRKEPNATVDGVKKDVSSTGA